MKPKLPYLTALFALTSCSFMPSSPSASSSPSKEQSTSTSSSIPSGTSDGTSMSSVSEETVSSSLTSSTEETQDPTLSLPMGEFGRVTIEKHQYATINYHILVPYQGNRYAFPKPILTNYTGNYSFLYSDSETILFTEEDGNLFIEVKYDFGGFFNMAAVDEQGTAICQIRLQAETTQTGPSELRVETRDGDNIKPGSTITLSPNGSLLFRGKFNNAIHADIFTVENDSIIQLSNTPYFATAKALSLGETKITAAYSEADATGASYDYSFEFTIKVEKVSNLTSIALPGEEVYLFDNRIVYNCEFTATFSDGSTSIITEAELSSKIEDDKAVFSYIHNDITKKVSYPYKRVSGESYNPTSLKYNFFDAWSNIGTGIDCLPSSGNINFLVIPVWFTNSGNYFNESKKNEICDDIQELLFGSHEGFETLKSFYEKESGGDLSLNGTIAPWYEDNQSSTFYNDQITTDVHNLGQRAVEDYFKKHTEDSLSNYDMDKDGKVDGLILMYGANFYGTSISANDSNAFASRFYDHGVGSHPVINAMCFCPIGGMYGFSSADTTKQRESDDLSKEHPAKFANGATTAIHEVGHMFGARDLYTRAAHSAMNTSGQKYEPAGRFSMQDNSVGSHDPLQTYLYGWGKPMVFDAKKYEIGASIDVYLEDFQSAQSTILLTPDWNATDSPFDEYLLLELFSPTGLNEYHAKEKTSVYDASGNGIRLWHSDAAMQRKNNGQRISAIDNGSLTFLADNHDVGDNRFYFNRFIRNDVTDTYETSSKFTPETLFHGGDRFSMDTYHKQFLDEKGLLDSGKKLGWEFEVTSIFHNGEGKYAGTVRLTRVDDTLTEFESSISFPGSALPSGEDIDATEYFQLPVSDMTLQLHQNDADEAIVTSWMSPDYLLHLPSATNQNGASMDITLLPKDGYNVTIKRIVLYYESSTSVTARGVPTVIVGDNVIKGTVFPSTPDLGPEDPLYMSESYEYSINASGLTIQNRDEHTIYVTALRIEYSIAKAQ